MPLNSTPFTKICSICEKKKHVSQFMPSTRINMKQHMCRVCNAVLQKENIQEQEISGVDQKRG